MMTISTKLLSILGMAILCYGANIGAIGWVLCAYFAALVVLG